MAPPRRPLPSPAGPATTYKYGTALRIAINIAFDDSQVTHQLREWSAEKLYDYLEKNWNFRWLEARNKWEQA